MTGGGGNQTSIPYQDQARTGPGPDHNEACDELGGRKAIHEKELGVLWSLRVLGSGLFD